MNIEYLVNKKYGHYGEYEEGKRQKVIIIHAVKGGNLHGHVQVAKYREASEILLDQLYSTMKVD